MASVGTAEGVAYFCGFSAISYSVEYLFGEGSIVYSIQKAKKGILEAIAIKRVRMINNSKTFGLTIPLYVDTNNWLWNEAELCIESDARFFAIAYWQGVQEEVLAELAKC